MSGTNLVLKEDGRSKWVFVSRCCRCIVRSVTPTKEKQMNANLNKVYQRLNTDHSVKISGQRYPISNLRWEGLLPTPSFLGGDTVSFDSAEIEENSVVTFDISYDGKPFTMRIGATAPVTTGV